MSRPLPNDDPGAGSPKVIRDDARRPQSSAWSPFRHRVFRDLWIAQFVSNVGTWMQTVGAVWVMLELKGSPTFVALVATASSLPTVFLGVAGGALADLLDRRRLLLVTQILMLAAAAALAALDASGGLDSLVAPGIDVRARSRCGPEQPRLAGDPAGARAS